MNVQQKKGKKALVLSGGSIWGAFQAGAIRELLNRGFQPDIIMGISAGALNSAFLVNEAGKMGAEPDWPSIGQELKDFWLNNVQEPSDLIEKTGTLKQIWRLAKKRFNGLMDYEPLVKLIREQFNLNQLKNSPVELIIGAVNWTDGHIEYPNQKSDQIIDYIIASASIPFLLPYWTIKGTPYIDGGMRDSVPLRKLVQKDIDEVVVVLTQPALIPRMNPEDAGNLSVFLPRVVELLLNEILVNDLATLERINQDLLLLEKVNEDLKKEKKEQQEPIGSLTNKRQIKSTIIRPSKAYATRIETFSEVDIQKMIKDGEKAARFYQVPPKAA